MADKDKNKLKPKGYAKVDGVISTALFGKGYNSAVKRIRRKLGYTLPGSVERQKMEKSLKALTASEI